MQEFETEEQQVEAVKKWLKDNSVSLLLGLFIGLGGIFGWREYQQNQVEHNMQASDLYLSVTEQIGQGKTLEEAEEHKLDKLYTEYKDTPYASLVSLALAKYEYDKNNPEKAIEKLRWVVDNANDELKYIAALRLAKVLLEQKQFEQLEKLLAMNAPESFSSAYDEIRGDYHYAQGNKSKAKEFYDKAMKQKDRAGDRFLKFKQDATGAG